MSGHLWLPSVAVSRGADDGYERPALTGNAVGDLAEFGADGIQFGFSVFEGMRAYADGTSVLVFRARDHHERLRASCAALALPCPDYEVFTEAIEHAVCANDDGVTTRLYVRPIVFAASGDVMPLRDGRFVFAVLVKAFDPVIADLGVLVEEHMPRTVPMFAAVKTAGNYTSSALAMRDAHEAGCDTVLWLDGGGNIAECTTMNVFLFLDGRIVTPGLGAILPGVTRGTVLDLLAEAGEPVEERDVPLAELADRLAAGESVGVCTTSTALGIRRVSRLRLGSRDHRLEAKTPDAWQAMRERYAQATERFAEAPHPLVMARSHLFRTG
ncbi:aminotransferase class IV [Planotetraspora sp. A-T 1434]|uniref:aminotransferase class IV n=1 Tax=Planotetraspora sp. A-T 1434 TaxID=2979219 RepID=UPI0021C18B0A|nr:aminotransferase class IV [Planotetraspora sp. A-T 1434]MCT9933012.1 aminotransferase class IV [Planotetraspora sp. A-T 1434]